MEQIYPNVLYHRSIKQVSADAAVKHLSAQLVGRHTFAQLTFVWSRATPVSCLSGRYDNPALVVLPYCLCLPCIDHGSLATSRFSIYKTVETPCYSLQIIIFSGVSYLLEIFYRLI